MTCEVLIRDYFATLERGFHCAPDPDGRLAIVTPYLYPDHDFIEVFVRDKGDSVVVSDLGETLRQLDTLGLDVCGTPRLKFAAERIAGGLGVTVESGVLVKRGPVADAGKLFFDVVSAVKLVSSLAYGNRAYEPIGFDEQVKDLFDSSGIPAELGVELTGASHSKYHVSFKVPTPRGDAFLQTISPAGPGGMKAKVNAAFRMWSDLGHLNFRVSLLNDEDNKFRGEDVAMLERVSRVHRWTVRDALIRELKAVAL